MRVEGECFIIIPTAHTHHIYVFTRRLPGGREGGLGEEKKENDKKKTHRYKMDTPRDLVSKFCMKIWSLLSRFVSFFVEDVQDATVWELADSCLPFQCPSFLPSVNAMSRKELTERNVRKGGQQRGGESENERFIYYIYVALLTYTSPPLTKIH